jgi:hypothetical protein
MEPPKEPDVDAHVAELLADLASNTGAGLAVCDGLIEHLTAERDSKRADERS